MLIGHLKHPATFAPLVKDPAWEIALQWLKGHATPQQDGEYEIQGRDIYASVSSLTTLPRSTGTFEAHQRYADIHYLISGEEVIEWAPVDTLTPTIEYNTEKDYCLYKTPSAAAPTFFTPGMFGIYLPGDAHMPKLATATGAAPIRKIVVKVAL